MSDVIRVAQVIGNANAGGVESLIMNVYKNIDRSKIQFDFFVQQTCPIIDRKVIESMGGKIVIIPPVKKLSKYKKELKRLFIEGQYKIVHSNMNTLSVFTLKAAKRAGVPIRIAESHSTASKKEPLRYAAKNILKKFSKKYSTCWLACSKNAAEFQFGKRAVNEGKVKIIETAIDVEKFKYNPVFAENIRKKYNISKTDFVIGHVGRFVSVKNHMFILDIFSLILKNRPNSKLLLVGDGPLKKDVEQRAKELDIFDKIIFTGTDANVVPYYSAMNAFVLPSFYEGFGLVGLEAQASGLNVYLSNNVPTESHITDRVKSLEIGNAQNWADNILKDSYDYDRSVYNSQIAKTRYDIHETAKEYENLYTELLNQS